LFRLDTLYQVDFVLLQRDRLVCLVMFVLAAVMTGSYKRFRITERFDAVYYILVAVAATAVAQLALATLLPKEIRVISRRELVLGIALGALLLAVWRAYAARFIARFKSLHRFYLVMGNEREGRRIAGEIRAHPSLQADAEYVPSEELSTERSYNKPELDGVVPVQTEAIIVLADDSRNRLTEILEVCQDRCQRTFLYSSLHDAMLFQHKDLFAIANIPLIEIAGRQPTTTYLYMKRCIDCAVAATGLLLALPICIVMAAAIALTSRGGVLYKQERPSKGGGTFKIYKLRSMVVKTDAEADYDLVSSAKNDPRITRVGRFMRKYKIDEIPQLYNVLKGDMSLVGPRPLLSGYCAPFGGNPPLWKHRLAVRPGLTSLSHVLGSSFLAPEDILRYDLMYIGSVSFFTDLKILIATVRTVLGGKGGQ